MFIKTRQPSRTRRRRFSYYRQLRRTDYGQPGDPDRDHGFGWAAIPSRWRVPLAFIMMQAQVTTFAEAATLIPTTGLVYDHIACGMGVSAITGALCAHSIAYFAGTAETILAGVMGAGEL